MAVSVVVVDKKSVKTVKSVAALNNVSIVNTGRKSARIGLLSPMHYTA